VPTIYKDVPHVVFESWDDQKFLEPVVSLSDRQLLRELASEVATYATLPVNTLRKEQWSRINDLQDCKPMVWVNEVCWNEMSADGELSLHTSSPFCRRIETELRQTVYQWKHFQCDMVIEPVLYSPLIVSNTGIGLSFQEDVIKTDEDNEVVSHRFHPQVERETDIDKILAPQVSYRKEESLKTFEAYRTIFDGVLRVEQRGAAGFWFAPWDDIVRLTGVQEALVALAERPDFIHALVRRVVDVYIQALEQYERLGIIASNNTNMRIGSGAYGYTGALPAPRLTGVQCAEIWGAATAQIFAGVSPAMHEEFGLTYERKWLARFGLAYYGCCEPLDRKIAILRSIPNLRKVSMSPWVDLERATESVGGDFVFSYKPSPAVFARDAWDPEAARKDLERALEAGKRHGCKTEIIMKDISTVRHEPSRLWEWARVAKEVTERYD
jgi:hypothetical protein